MNKKKSAVRKSPSSTKKNAAKKKTTKKSATKKASVKKSASPKKAAATKKAAKKTTAKKSTAIKTTTAKKTIFKKKAATKKTTVKKSPVGAKKKAAKKTTATKKTVAKKKATKKKKAVAKVAKKKTVVKKAAPSKKTIAKKATIKTPRSTVKKTSVAPKKKTTIRTANATTRRGRRPSRRLSILEKAATVPPRHFFQADLPQQYNETYLRAIVRDPNWLFLYWEITNDSLARLKDAMGENAYKLSSRIIRLLNITDIDYDGNNAVGHTDTDIGTQANNTYVRLPAQGKTFIAECGHRTPDGLFFLLARSNTVTIPRAAVSVVTDEQWNAPETPELIRASAASPKPIPVGSSEFAVSEQPGVSRGFLFPGSSDNVSGSNMLFPGASDNVR